MYAFLNGLRYSYYYSDENACDSTYWSSLDTSEAIPNPNSYSFSNDTLSIDLFFGNTWQYLVTFECNENIVSFGNTTFDWWKVGLDTSECEEQQLAISSENTPPEKFRSHQNYPNSFNPVTNISYDLLGNVLNNLVNTNQLSGYKTIQWNATNNEGQPVSAGVYLFSIEAGEFRQTKKMVFLK